MISFSEQHVSRKPLGDWLFHVQVAGFKPAYTITTSKVLFMYFGQEWEVAIGRYSFNQNPWNLPVKKDNS